LRQREHNAASLRSLERLASLMDERFQVPGTNFRFGLDGLLGLIPGVGDTATGLIGLYIIYQARQHGAPGSLLARMVGNVAIDTAVGSIPLLGDVFDFGFKAHRRNLKLLHRHLERSGTGLKLRPRA
jgi:hypothetical protein